jgi:hydrogenase expression/formation protein HypC
MCLAVPGKIESIEGSDPVLKTGKVNFGGILKQINLAYVPEARVGDYVLVHVGFAISTIEESEAREVFEYLRQLGDLSELDDNNDLEAKGQS